MKGVSEPHTVTSRRPPYAGFMNDRSNNHDPDTQATMKNLQTKVHALDQEQTRQQELIYSAEFQIQQMERKVARGMGERTDEEKSQLNSKIRELEVRPPLPYSAK